ncbi:MAG: glycosyltransferase family 39 protein [Magnetococcales bacterium]|nr:glycosyltransferase family 39 protein [Magnetococcales bacterium]
MSLFQTNQCNGCQPAMIRRLHWVLLLSLTLAGVVISFLHLRTLSEPELREWLTRWSGLFLGIHATLIVLLGILESERIIRIMRSRLPGRLLWMIPLLFMTGTLATAWLAPQTHRIYYDETIYLSIGQNLAHLNRAQICNSGGESYGQMQCDQGEYNKQPNGYPFLVSLLFRLAGTSEQAAFWLNNGLLGLTAVTVFLLIFPLGGGWRTGLFAALIVIFIPQNLHWFNTTSAEPAAALTVAMAILAGFYYRHVQTGSALILLTLLTAFALSFRPESLLLLPLIALTTLPVIRTHPISLFVALILFFCLTMPLWLHLGLFHNHPWGSSGKPFSLDYFSANLLTNGWHYLNNQHHPLLFSLLALLGLTSIRQRPLAVTVIILWFWFFWGIFLFFYAGSYQYGADVRFSVVSSVPLALLAGLGSDALWHRSSRWTGNLPATRTGLMIALLGCSLFPFLPQIRATTHEAWAARADVRFARQMVSHLPPEALVLTHNPNLFQLWGVHAAQLSLASTDPNYVNQALANRYRGGIYLHFNFWCNVPDPVQNQFCDHVLSQYNSTQLVEFYEGNFRYALHRLHPKPTPQSP